MRPRFRTFVQSTPRRRQWQLWTALVFAIGALIAAAQWRDHLDVEQSEREHLRTQARVADQLLTTQIQSADAALRTMLDGLDRWRGPQGYLPFAHDHLKRIKKMMPGARTFAVLDAQGVCQLSNQTELLGLDFSKRNYFTEARQDPGSETLNIGAPYRTVLGAWAVTLSRPITNGRGQFGGVVAATISPEYFDTLMQNLRYAKDMRVSLIHDQGQVYVTSPSSEALLMQDFSKGDNFFSQHMASGETEGSLSGSGLDGLQRISMARTVSLDSVRTKHHFIAIAGRESSAVFAPWRKATSILFGVWVLSCLISAWVLARYQKRSALLVQQAEEATQAVHRSNQRFEQLAQTIPCVLFDFEVQADGKVQVQYVGPYSHTLLGRAPSELVASPALFLKSMHADDRNLFQTQMQQALTAGTGFDCEMRLTDTRGQERWLKMTATPGTETRADDSTHFSGFLFDVTEARLQQARLHDMAYHDPLTRAKNRRSFVDALELELARIRRFGGEAALIMLDIDFFKHVNDTHGHDVGDAVLEHLVGVLQGGAAQR